MLLDPVNSITNFSFYKEVPRKSIASTVGYLIYLGLFFALALTASLYINLRPKIAEAVEWAATSIPTMTLSGGKLSSTLTAPLLIRHPRIREAAFIIDTNRVETVTQAEMEQKGVTAYLTQNAIYVYEPGSKKMEVYDLSKAANTKPLVIDANFYRTLGAALNRMLYPIAFGSAWLGFLIWKHIATLFYSLLALIINGIASGGLSYSSLYKITIYSQTPAIALQIVTLLHPTPTPLFALLEILIVGVYLWQGIRQQHTAPPEPQPQAV